MWSFEILGTDLYHILACFCVYSILGWCVESLYMSYCNKKITNRGFAAMPFCPIYGFGAVAGYLVLRPLTDSPVLLYLAGAIGATFFEYLVAVLMKKLLHEVWWDYNMKPLNFQGVICLESTLAWGIYAIVVVRHLHVFVVHQIDKVPQNIMKNACLIVLGLYLIDFTYHLLKALGVGIGRKKSMTV